MNHKYKTALFKCLNILPNKAGYFLYHNIQNLFSQQTLDYKIKSTEHSFDTVCRILKKNNITLKNKHVTEMGSGWVPIFPYLIKFNLEANVVNTYDINEHYKLSDILKLNRLFTEKYNILKHFFIGKYQLPTGINYFPNTDVCKADLKNTDLIISRFVLEHVPPLIISEIHDVFFKNLKSGSYLLHLISPSDHRAYSDNSLSLYDFLKYNEAEWNNIQTKFDYHNRLRLPQYIEIFDKNFEIIHIEYDYCQKRTIQYDKFKTLKIDENFKKYSEKELTAGSINILLRVI